MKTMAVIVMAVTVNGANLLAAVRSSDDPPKAAEVTGDAKHELKLRKVSRDRDGRAENAAQVRFEVLAAGFEDDWVCWSREPRITRLTDTAGKSLIERDRGLYGETGEWVSKGKAFRAIDARLKDDRIDAFGSVEVEAEITVARDLVFLELGELKGLDKRIEIAPDAILTLRAFVEEWSCSFFEELLDERKDKGTRVLVGLETFDKEGRPSDTWGFGKLGLEGVHLFRNGRPTPHTGRLVLANRLERIPLKFNGTNVKLGGVSLQDVKTMTVEAMEKN